MIRVLPTVWRVTRCHLFRSPSGSGSQSAPSIDTASATATVPELALGFRLARVRRLAGPFLHLSFGLGHLPLVLAFWAMATAVSAAAEPAAWVAGVQPDGSVVDDAGRRIAMKRPFSRIISLYGAHTETLFALGLDEQVIGVGRTDTSLPAAAAKPVFSYHEDPEKILAARPVTVASFQPATVDEMLAYWASLGRLTGRDEAAHCLVASFQTALSGFARLRERVEKPKTVFFEAIHAKMKTFTPAAMPGFALAQAGGVNIAADARQVRDTNIAFYGREQVLAKGGQIDVYLAQAGTMNPVSVDQIKNEPGFKAIKAVRDNRVHLVDEMLVSRPTPRLLEGIFQIGALLYPDIFNAAARGQLHLELDCRVRGLGSMDGQHQ